MIGSKRIFLVGAAKGLALERAIERFGIRKAPTFHRTNKAAKSMGDFLSERKQFRRELYRAYGVMEKSALKKDMEKFASANCAITHSAKVLTEGADYPAADTVAVMGSKRSAVDILQMVGSALRTDHKHKDKVAVIVIPAILNPDNAMELLSELGKREIGQGQGDRARSSKAQKTTVAATSLAEAGDQNAGASLGDDDVEELGGSPSRSKSPQAQEGKNGQEEGGQPSDRARMRTAKWRVSSTSLIAALKTYLS